MKLPPPPARPRPAPADLPKAVRDFIEECRLRPHPESYLIAVLQKVQDHDGYLSPARLDAVSQALRIPSATVSGVANFYHFFTFVPRGKHRIAVCLGTACYVKGAGLIVDRLNQLLGIGPGETTPDRAFSLDAARCLGACAMAPILVVDGKVYGNVKPDDVERILADYGFRKPATPATPGGTP